MTESQNSLEVALAASTSPGAPAPELNVRERVAGSLGANSTLPLPRNERERFWQNNDAELRRLWPIYSASEIAVIIGDCTKNGVIGRGRRIGLPAKAKTGEARKIRIKAAKAAAPKIGRSRGRNGIATMINKRIAAKVDPRPPKFKIEALPIEEPSTDKAVFIWDLDGTTCRWPVGEATGSAQMYCGVPSADLAAKCPYCPFHMRKSIQKTQPARGHHGQFIASPWS